jgi:ribosomal protein S11
MAKKGKIRKNVVRGIVHIKSTQNNTIVTITDTNGETLAWDSAGTIGFKGARKSTPFAATRAAEQAAGKARKMGMTEVEIRIKGSGDIDGPAPVTLLLIQVQQELKDPATLPVVRGTPIKNSDEDFLGMVEQTRLVIIERGFI